MASPMVSNIFIEHFVEIALDTADHKPAKWLRYVEDTMVWPHGQARLQKCLHHLNRLRPTIKFTIMVMKWSPKLATKVCQKPTHTVHYLHFKSNHPHHVIREVVHSSISRAKVTCQDQKDFSKEIENIRHDVMLNEYP
jgi:hypothetical protein